MAESTERGRRQEKAYVKVSGTFAAGRRSALPVGHGLWWEAGAPKKGMQSGRGSGPGTPEASPLKPLGSPPDAVCTSGEEWGACRKPLSPTSPHLHQLQWQDGAG